MFTQKCAHGGQNNDLFPYNHDKWSGFTKQVHTFATNHQIYL